MTAGEPLLRRDMAHDAWGEPGAEPELSETVRAMLALTFGDPGVQQHRAEHRQRDEHAERDREPGDPAARCDDEVWRAPGAFEHRLAAGAAGAAPGVVLEGDGHYDARSSFSATR